MIERDLSFNTFLFNSANQIKKYKKNCLYVSKFYFEFIYFGFIDLMFGVRGM